MPEQLHILIVEDSEDDALLLLRELRKGGYEPVYERVETREGMKAALEKGRWEVVISDYVLPGFSGLAAISLLRESGQDLPFIIVSGNIGEDIAVGAMKAGAHDYIIKGNLARLVPAIERELREAEVRREKRRAEEELRRYHAELEKRVEERTSELVIALHESRQYQAEITALLEASRAVMEQRDFKDTAWLIFNSCKNLIGATAGYVALLSKDGNENEILFLDAGGAPCTIDPSLPMPIRGLRAAAYSSGRTVYENDFPRSEWLKFMPEGHAHLDNVMFAPLLIGAETAGILGFANKKDGFTDNDARMATAFGELASISLHNSRLFDLLKNSEQKFRSVVQTASDAIISIDSKGSVISWNRGAELTFGYRADEITGKPFELIMPEGMVQDYQNGMTDVVTSGLLSFAGRRFETTGRRKDGGKFPLELSCAQWETREGIFSTVIIRDITESKKAADALRESEQRLNRSQEIAHLGSWELDLENNRLYWSDEVYRIFGFQPQEFGATYEAFIEAIHPGDRAAVNTAYTSSLIDERDAYEIEHRVVKKSTGEVRTVYEKCSHLRDESGRVIRSIGMVHDITERKQAEEKLQASELWLHSIYNSLDEAVLVISPDRKLVNVNRAAEVMFGYSEEELRSCSTEVLHVNHQNYVEFGRRIQGAFSDDRVANFKFEAKRKNGEIFPTEHTASLLKNKNGDILGIVSVVRDITERKRAEEERERLFNELVRSNKELEQFAYIASHDLQEPLRMVSSYVELLGQRYKGRLDKDADEFIGYAVSGTIHMQALLNDLLAYSRVGTKGGALKLTDLNSALNRALINLKVGIDQTRAEITHESLPVVYADEVQMVQVFQNLLSNAMKFCNSGTPHISVSAEMKDNEWVIRFKDDGIGIDPKYFDRIFHIFKRLHTKEEYIGTGIGLAICKKIIERHKGRIWVDSEPGKGSSFYFTIPAKKGDGQ